MNVVNTTKTVFRRFGIHLFALPAAVGLFIVAGYSSDLQQPGDLPCDKEITLKTGEIVNPDPIRCISRTDECGYIEIKYDDGTLKEVRRICLEKRREGEVIEI